MAEQTTTQTPVKRATLINKQTGDRVAVDVGSQEAQQYFGKGYALEGAGEAPDKPATLVNPTTGERQRTDTAAQASELFGRGYILEEPSVGRIGPNAPPEVMAQVPSNIATAIPPTRTTSAPRISTTGVAPKVSTGVPRNVADVISDAAKAGAQTGVDTILGAPDSYDNKVLRQKGAIMSALLGDAVTPEDLRFLSPQQQAAVRSGQKSALEAELVGLNSIITGRKELKKAEEERALKQFDIFSQSGISPDQLPTGFLSSLDAQIGLPDGTFSAVYRSNYATNEAEKMKASLEAATSLNEYLDTIPAGQTVSIGGNTYVGTDSGKIEINELTGDVYALREDPDSPSGFSVMSIGNVGSQKGREIIEQYNASTGNKEYWSVDPNNPSDARPVTQGGFGGASSQGVNTYALMEAFPQGEGFSDTSWCLEWLRNISEEGSLPPAGSLDTIDQKAAWADRSITTTDVRAGDIILTNEDSQWGHAAIITGIQTNPAGQKVAILAESNYQAGKVTYGRTIVLDENNMAQKGGVIMGFQRSKLKSQYTSQPQGVTLIAEGGGSSGEPLSFSEISSLRKEFTSSAKTFVDTRDAYSRILASAKDPSAAGDLALIFNYMKVLDPGSTVREGEFANAENSGGIPDVIRSRYNKVISGERLSSDMRTDFVSRSGNLYQAQYENAKPIIDTFTREAELAGIDVGRITGTIIDPSGKVVIGGSTQPVPTVSQVIQNLSGKTTASGDTLTDSEKRELANFAISKLNSGYSNEEVTAMINQSLGY